MKNTEKETFCKLRGGHTYPNRDYRTLQDYSNTNCLVCGQNFGDELWEEMEHYAREMRDSW